MKIQKLRRIIFINITTSIVLIAAFASIFFYILNLGIKSEQNAQKIRTETIALKARSVELEGKIKEAKKYQEIWKTIDKNKKNTQVIKIDDINKILNDIAQKHNVLSPKIQIILPVALNDGVFKRSSINTLYATGSLSFRTIDDITAMEFIQDFISQLPGHIVLTSTELRKEKNYSSQDLVDLSKGISSGNVLAQLNFSWYSYRDKEKPEVK